MNHKLHIITIQVLGMMILMPSFSYAFHKADSVILNRIWRYAGKYAQSVEGMEQNVYMNFYFQTERRNPTLFLIPTMYSVAKGDREYFGESYNKLTFHSVNDYDIKEHVVCGTIPSYRNVMPRIKQFITPALYNVTLYQGYLLSPFNYANRRLYTYKTYSGKSQQCILEFVPRVSNTQLVKGYALVNTSTGYILSTIFEGDYDMVAFKVSVRMRNEKLNLLLPERCTTEATFKFIGNHIQSTFLAQFGCPTTLPDSIEFSHDRELMDSIRPIRLKRVEQAVYDHHDQEQQLQAEEDTIAGRKHRKFKDFMWDVVGDNLVNSLQAGRGTATLRISPLLNPLYFGYSKSRGISYKLNIGARYNWNEHRYLTLDPQFGYNFRQKQFYYIAPLRMTYNPKRNGYAEITWANGNRISNGALVDDVQQKMGKDFQVPEYEDEYVQAVNNVNAFDWMGITAGLVYHHRSSTNQQMMRDVGMNPIYRSFGPLLTLHFYPWQENGPTLTANYEHSFSNMMNSDLRYDRWEFDLSFKRRLKSLQAVNFRVGTGFYTSRNTEYFVDFNNFRDNNLPTGWDDDWTGQFQLLESKWYNESNYYLRGHISYESPFLALTWLPVVGRFLETERLYFSALSIQHTRPYCELGYGFTNRYFSTGVFVSFLNTKFKDFGCRITIELFRKW